MKRNVFNIIMSILLILAGLAAIGGGVFGGFECYALREMSSSLEETLEPMGELEEALQTLLDTEEDYLGGVDAIAEGDEKIGEGNSMVSQGKAVLRESEAELADAQAVYDEAVAKLAEGQAQVDEAKAMMEESRPSYEEGKEQLENLEKLQPMLTRYLELRQNSLEGTAGFDALDKFFDNTIVPACARLGLELPSDPYAFQDYMSTQIAEGNAMLKQYEDAEAALVEAQAQIDEAQSQLDIAKAELDKGYNAIEDGYSEIWYAEGQLGYAASQISEGKASLAEYEDAVAQIRNALDQLIETETTHDRDGNEVVPSIKTRLGEDFSLNKYDEQGKKLYMENGMARLDYSKSLEVCAVYKEFVADYQQGILDEALVRFILDCAIVLAGLFAVVCGILTLCAKPVSFRLSKILGAALIAIHIYGIIVGYAGFAFPEGEETYHGILPLLGIWILTLIAIPYYISVRRGRMLYVAEAPIEPEPEEAATEELCEEAEELPLTKAEISAKKKAEKKAMSEALKKAEQEQKLIRKGIRKAKRTSVKLKLQLAAALYRSKRKKRKAQRAVPAVQPEAASAVPEQLGTEPVNEAVAAFFASMGMEPPAPEELAELSEEPAPDAFSAFAEVAHSELEGTAYPEPSVYSEPEPIPEPAPAPEPATLEELEPEVKRAILRGKSIEELEALLRKYQDMNI